MSNLYTCAECGGKFEKGWTDEEAIAEKDKLFPDVPVEDCIVVCSDCFKRYMGITSEGMVLPDREQ